MPMLYELLPSDTALTVDKYYNEYYNYYRMPEHSHNAFEVMYVKSGKCRVTCVDRDTDKVSDIKLSGGSYIYIYSGVKHNLFIDRENPCRILNIEIDAVARTGGFSISAISKTPSFESFVTSAPQWAVVRDDGSFYVILYTLLEKMNDTGAPHYRNTISDPNALDDDATIGLALSQLVLTLAIQTQNVSMSGIPTESYIRKARKYIYEHFDGAEELTVSNIATYVSVSPAYLQRLFRASTGMTLIEYANRLRLDKAKRLIKNTNLSIVDIAVNSGFGSRQRLHQVFSKNEGISPGRYRELKKMRAE